MTNQTLPRNLGFELVRVTEQAALTAGRWMGLNRAEEADQAAGLTMQRMFGTLAINGRLAIGEDAKLDAQVPLHSGQALGTGHGPAVDVVADAIDGCRLLAQGHGAAVAVAAVAPRGAMWAPVPAIYMDKIIVGQDVGAALVPECLGAPAAWTLALVARARGKRVGDLVVFVLARPRHDALVNEIRAAGARVMLSPDGDILGALLAITPNSGVDLLMGIGGVPEGVIAACAVRAAGGAMLGRLAPQSAEERAAVQAAGLDTRQIVSDRDIVNSDQVFFAATGITDGPLLRGVHYLGDRATSNSLILRGETHTRRWLVTEHLLSGKESGVLDEISSTW
ncbi:MAG: class II fructose-bisphosphatase [Anaerolineae bacterium]|nr:class II fructose-bisphosphatase [Anaerolineae bacterium]